MSDPFFNEQICSNSRSDRASEVVAHGYLSVFPSDYASQATTDITRTSQILPDNVLYFPGMHGHEPNWATNQVPCPSNQTDKQFSGHLFPHTAQEFSPVGVLRFEKPTPHHLSVSEEITLTRLGRTLVPRWRHTITPPGSHPFQKLYCLTQRNHVGSSQLLPQAVTPRLYYASYPLSQHSTRQADYFELQWTDGVRPCGAVGEGSKSGLSPYVNAAQAVHQEKVISPNSGLSFARNEPLLRHTTRASASIRDKGVPAVLTTESLHGYNQDWSPLDMITFNGHLISTKEVVCQWIDYGTPCGDPVKGKDLSAHLCLRHCVTSDSRLYKCLWRNCASRPMKKSSLERHMKERHVPVSWACPTCEKTFTREGTLKDHFNRCPGHV